jgi:hypothetical protein
MNGVRRTIRQTALMISLIYRSGSLQLAARVPSSRSVRAVRGRISALYVFHSNMVLYGTVLWVYRRVNAFWRFWARAVDFFGTGTRATGLSLTLGAGLALILNFGILRPQKGAAITCGKDDLCTCDETSTWNNNCKPWDLYLTNDMVAALVSWVFSVIFTWLIPSTVADLTEEKPRPKWLAWDNPNPELLKKFGDRMLTYDVASTICNKRNIPTNNNGWILCLVAWCISVLSIPWEGGWGGDTNADGVYTPPMPASYWFGSGLRRPGDQGSFSTP